MKSTLILWDSTADLPEHDGEVYTWNGYNENDSIHSLLQYVETHSKRLRRKYLAWVHDLGVSRVDGRRLIDHLAFDDGLSYWWMTLFVEKSPWKSPSIVDTMRLFALEEIIIQQKLSKLQFVSANRSLHVVLSDLCENLEIAYEWKQLPGKSKRQISLGSVYNSLPHPAKAIISLILYARERWASRQAKKPDWFSGDKALFFCSYFNHFDLKSAEEGRFYSFYWAGLQPILKLIGYKGNWSQLFYACEEAPTPSAAMGRLQRFNQQRQELYHHALLDTYLSWRIMLRVLRRWLKLMLISWRLTGVEHAFRPHGSGFSVWPLMQADWYASMRGSPAINNLLFIELFDEIMHDLPHQKKGLYLCENQAWERALIHAWRKHEHGQLVAVPSSTVRFWHLSYFSDQRTVRSVGKNSLPQPDLMALNGKDAINAFLSAGYQKEAIVECEALRYSHLHSITANGEREGDEIKVLVVGEGLYSGTIEMLQLLKVAVPHISARVTFTMKPHADCMVNARDYPTLNLKVIMDPLGEILNEFDVVYSSNLTSASVDAFLIGLPVVIRLDPTGLNLSPLRGQPGIRFVATPKELAEALQIGHQNMVNRLDNNNFFFVDPELPKWRHLLEN